MKKMIYFDTREYSGQIDFDGPFDNCRMLGIWYEPGVEVYEG